MLLLLLLPILPLLVLLLLLLLELLLFLRLVVMLSAFDSLFTMFTWRGDRDHQIFCIVLVPVVRENVFILFWIRQAFRNSVCMSYQLCCRPPLPFLRHRLLQAPHAPLPLPIPQSLNPDAFFVPQAHIHPWLDVSADAQSSYIFFQTIWWRQPNRYTRRNIRSRTHSRIPQPQLRVLNRLPTQDLYRATSRRVLTRSATR